MMNDLQTISVKATQTAKLFGTDSEKRPRLSAALAITVCLGSICSWSSIRAPRRKLFSVDAAAIRLAFIVVLRSLPR
jgi:hypothetical protein